MRGREEGGVRAESERQNEQQRRYQRTVAIICPVIAAVGLLDAVLPSAMASLSFVVSIFRMWACLLPIGAVFLVLGERRLRSGESLHCPKCDYEFAHAADAAQPHAERCPECGFAWRDAWVKGRRGGSSARLKVFFVCGLIGLFVAGVNASRSMAFGARLTPTWFLVHNLQQAQDRRSFRFDDAWAELATRSLDAKTEAELVDLLIDSLRDETRGFTSRALEAWFSGVLASGRIPAETIARYLDQRVTSSLSVEADV